MAKPKIALYWAAGCGGCDVAVLDTNEKILDIAATADIVFWPAIMDFKYRHLEAMRDGDIDLCLFNGSIRDSEQERIARLFRARSKLVAAFGTCACSGGVPALANLSSRTGILERVYLEVPTAGAGGTLPQTLTSFPHGELGLPALSDSVSTLAQVIAVDCFLPGCPPPADAILKIVSQLATGKLPSGGTVVAPEKTVCDECGRTKEEKKIARVWRTHQILPDPDKCLLEQGIICMGPATRAGCGQACIKANMPCRGCFGPAPGVIDQGARMLSALTSIYEAREEGEIARLLDEVVDPAGTFYRFGMSASILRRKRPVPAEAGVR